MKILSIALNRIVCELTHQEYMAVSGLSEDGEIYPGQQILIPGGGPPASAGLRAEVLPPEPAALPMTFAEAMQELKQGKKIARATWKPGLWLEFGPHAPHVSVHLPDESRREWAHGNDENSHKATEGDRVARDWRVVE